MYLCNKNAQIVFLIFGSYGYFTYSYFNIIEGYVKILEELEICTAY